MYQHHVPYTLHFRSTAQTKTVGLCFNKHSRLVTSTMFLEPQTTGFRIKHMIAEVHGRVCTVQSCSQSLVRMYVMTRYTDQKEVRKVTAIETAYLGQVTRTWVTLGRVTHTWVSLGRVKHTWVSLGRVTHTWVSLGQVTHTWGTLGRVTHTWVSLGQVTHTWVTLGRVTHTWVSLGPVTHTWVSLHATDPRISTALHEVKHAAQS